MYMGKSVRTAAGFLLTVCAAAVLASGCSLEKTQSAKQSIDPPPEQAETIMEMQAADPAATGNSAAKQTEITVYYKDEHGFVSPVSLNVANTERIAQKALELMVEGAARGIVPPGFTGLLPTGTKVKGINIMADKKLAVVDFSREFTNYNAQDERKILEAVTWTLTGFPSVDKVRLRVEGVDLKEMPIDATPLDRELSRAMGINLEIAPGVDPGQAQPVTLYFLAQTKDKKTYYVPVTRMVKRTDQTANAVMLELARGPAHNKGLNGTIADGVEALKVKLSDDKRLITVDFNSKFLDNNKKASPAAMQAVVLSLTENTGAAQVQITVNGEGRIIAADNQTYSKPVTRPAHINSFKM